MLFVSVSLRKSSYLLYRPSCSLPVGLPLCHPETAAAMSEAARRIANNHLEIHLPHSPIAEIAQVIEALTIMSTALRAATSRQAELEQERRLFIGAIAHDLRTPLFSLRGYLEAVQTGVARSGEQVKKYLALSQKKAEALERLIGICLPIPNWNIWRSCPNRNRSNGPTAAEDCGKPASQE